MVNNLTTIKDKITGALAFASGPGNQYFTVSGTGTLVLADQGDWTVSGAATNGIQNSNNGSTLLVAGPTIRFGSSSVVSGGAITTGPLGKGTFTIQGAASIGSFLQDNGTNISIANAVFMNVGNPIKFDSTGAGSITFDGTGVTGASAVGTSLNIAGTSTLTLTPDSTVIINDRIVANGGTAAAAGVLNIGTNSTTSGGGNAYPYGTVVLNQPSAASGTTNVGSTFSGGVNLNYATLVVGANPNINGSALTSGPLGTGRLTINGNFPILEDNGTAITIANNVTIGNNWIEQSLGGSITIDGTGLTTKTTVTVNGAGNNVINGTLTIKSQVTNGQNLVMAGSGKLELNNSSGSNSTYNGLLVDSGLVQVDSAGSLGNGTNALATGNNYKTLVSYGGTLTAGPTFTGLQASLFNVGGGRWSSGTYAITNTGTANAQNTDNYDWSAAGANMLAASFGAVGGTVASPVIYSGSVVPGVVQGLTPNGTVYRLGGGGGVLQMNQALVNTDSLIVGGGGTGGTVILNGGAFTGTTYVNCGNLQLNTAPGAGAGSITVAPGGGISGGGTFGPLTTNLLPLITASSSGVVALSGNSAENLDFTAIPNMGLGAEQSVSVSYTGTLTPVAGTLRLGGGGGTLTMGNTLADVGGATSVVAFGGGSGGTLILQNNNTFSGGLTLLPGVIITPYFAGAAGGDRGLGQHAGRRHFAVEGIKRGRKRQRPGRHRHVIAGGRDPRQWRRRLGGCHPTQQR